MDTIARSGHICSTRFAGSSPACLQPGPTLFRLDIGNHGLKTGAPSAGALIKSLICAVFTPASGSVIEATQTPTPVVASRIEPTTTSVF